MLQLCFSSPLKDELDRVTQSAFEPTQCYVRRFRELADMAYPINTRNVDQERLLIKTFARGLASDAIAAKLVEGEPISLEAAVILVAKFCSRQDAYSRLGRVHRSEEPMEIGASDSDKHIDRAVASLTSTMQHLATKVAKLEARDSRMPTDHHARGVTRPTTTRAQRPPPDHHSTNRPARQGNDRRARNEQQPPARPTDFRSSYPAGPRMTRQLRCFACGRPGHFAINCPTHHGSYLPRTGNDRTSWQQ